MPLFTSSNKVEAYILNKLKAVADLMDSEGVEWIVGEYGIPTNVDGGAPNGFGASEQADFNAAGQKGAEYIQARGGYLYGWATGHEWTPYFLNPYTVNNSTGALTVHNNASAYEAVYDSKIGLNYAGNEFYVDTSNNPPTFGSGLNASAPSSAVFTSLYARGLRTIRYPVGQPASGGQWVWDSGTSSLRTNFVGHIENVLNRAQAVGMTVLLDILHPGGGANYAKISGNNIAGTSSTTGPGFSEYMNYFGAMVNHSFNDNNGSPTTIGTHPALVAIDPVNEPQYGNTTNIATWQYCLQQIFTQARASGGINYQGKLVAPAGNYSGAQEAPTNNPSITDPASNMMKEWHFYWDCSNCGGCGAGNWANYLSCRSAEPDFSHDTGSGSPPTAPSGLAVSQTGNNKAVNLTWTDNSADETSFVVERKVGAGSYSTLASKSANATSHEDNSVSYNTSYTYRVKASNGSGDSAYTSEVSITPKSGATVVGGQTPVPGYLRSNR